MAESANRCDVLIGGGSFAGLALAIALKQALGPTYRVTVADPALGQAADDARASAIVAAARRLFETIGVWDIVVGEAQPIVDLHITDSRLGDAVRPVFLTFHGDVQQGRQVHAGGVDLPASEPFAHMIENKPLLAALVERAKLDGVELVAQRVTGQAGAGSHILVTLADGRMIAARLLVAADGARSGIRQRAGIATHGWDYGQSGIVTTVAHERDHGGCAEEHFLPGGPFAILPLKGQRSSIVWTDTTAEADRIVALPDAEFHAELERRFGLHLGEISAVGARLAFPLGFAVARTFVAERIALVGDAAHVIHPIAGQGLNMGLKDVAALAEVIVDAARLGIDPATVLERYQRWRRFDTMAMGVATDGLNRLFSNHSEVLRAVRDLGLGMVDRLPVLKRMFIREAAGLAGDVPKLLKGEAL
jgi:2-octaprenyl-6-methoxyphenol hydroxylase